MDIQNNQITVQSHVNNLTNDEVFMFTSENHVNTMTSKVCTEFTSSLGNVVPEYVVVFW